MSEVATSHNFEKAKNELKIFSDNVPEATELPQLDTTASFFGMIDKKVTAEDINKITQEINNSFINYNDHIYRIIKEFGSVYNTFETLDKEYIQKFSTSIEAAEMASEQAKKASQEALSVQSDISRIIEVLQQNIAKLEEAKHHTANEFQSINRQIQQALERVESLEIRDVKEVESMKEEVQEQKVHLLDLSSQITDIQKTMRDEKLILDANIRELQEYKHKLEQVKSENDLLKKQMRIAFWIGGGALSLILLLLILQFIGVL